MPELPDVRIDSLLGEVEEIQGLNNGQGHTHPLFVTWRKRAEVAVSEKLGPEAEPSKELRTLDFDYHPTFWTESTVVTPQQRQRGFERDLNTAIGILEAAREAAPVERVSGGSAASGPLVYINHIGSTATAEARAQVTVQVTTEQLRDLLATVPVLTPEEREQALEALPDKDGKLTLDKVDRLLGVATKSKELFASILGWILAHAGDVPWQ